MKARSGLQIHLSFYSWRKSLSWKNSLELLVVPEFSCTVFVWPDDRSAWLWAAGRGLPPQVIPTGCKPSSTRWKWQPEIATEGKSVLLPKEQSWWLHHQKDYSCWFVHKKHRWRTPPPFPSSARSIIPSGLFSILLMFVKHLERQGSNDSPGEPISPSKRGHFSLFSTRTLAIPDT